MLSFVTLVALFLTAFHKTHFYLRNKPSNLVSFSRNSIFTTFCQSAPFNQSTPINNFLHPTELVILAHIPFVRLYAATRRFRDRFALYYTDRPRITCSNCGFLFLCSIYRPHFSNFFCSKDDCY